MALWKKGQPGITRRRRKNYRQTQWAKKKEYNFFMLKNPWTERRENINYIFIMWDKKWGKISTTQLEPKYILLVRECPLKVGVHTVINCIYTLIDVLQITTQPLHVSSNIVYSAPFLIEGKTIHIGKGFENLELPTAWKYVIVR